MKRIVFSLVLASAFTTSVLSAQSPAPTASAASTACPPSGTLDELIKAVDDAVSGPADKDRACLRALLLRTATLNPLAKAADGSFAPHVLTVDGWIEAVKKRGAAVFYERQVKVSSDVYGHIAHLWSTYEIRETPDGKAQVRGINSIQAVNDGTRWRIFELLWQTETPAEPVPARYLP